MAVAEIRPDWTIGTLNLTSGSTTFTTTGSMLQTAAIQAGDTIMVKGFVLVIATITGQNAGTLMEPCPAGAAGTGQPLRIRFQPDGSRYNGATADLVQLLGSGNVYEFAGLDGDGGGVPVFTGAGTMELGDYVADPNSSLAKLAALTLAAGKFLRTDGNGDIALSDLGAAAISLLNLSGTAAADRLPYLTGANGAGLTSITQVARNLLDDTSVAEQRATIGTARPAFRAFYPADAPIGNGTSFQTISSTTLNIGNLWSGTQFTCNEAGIYFFDYNVIISDGAENTGTLISAIILGESTEIGSSAVSKGLYFQQIYTSTIIRLNVGDVVRFRMTLEGLMGNPTILHFRSYANGALIG